MTTNQQKQNICCITKLSNNRTAIIHKPKVGWNVTTTRPMFVSAHNSIRLLRTRELRHEQQMVNAKLSHARFMHLGEPCDVVYQHEPKYWDSTEIQ